MKLILVFAAVSVARAAAPEYGYQVVHVYPHDRTAFTQGLEFRAGFLYEGTGLEGRSTLRKVKLETGEVVQRIDIAPQLFGEGITVINQQILQLTWKAQMGFVYEQGAFRRLRTFSYPGEGWGLTNDGTRIFMSDGSSQIRVWDGSTLHETTRLKVHDGPKPIEELNELEWFHGEILANVWQTDKIARISPADGKVIGWIDMTGILSPAEHEGADVLNGIAYDALGDRLFITGKLWPKLFEIKLVPKKASGSPNVSGTSGKSASPAVRR
jgi:glutamine cyclotransferase